MFQVRAVKLHSEAKERKVPQVLWDLGYLRVRFYLLEHPASGWSARVLGHRHEECYPPGLGRTGWGMGPAKGSVLEGSETSHSRACGMEEKTRAKTGEGVKQEEPK